MDLERSPPPDHAAEAAGGGACSICLDPVAGRAGGRSIAKLQCGHEFHLGQIPSPPLPLLARTCCFQPDLCARDGRGLAHVIPRAREA